LTYQTPFRSVPSSPHLARPALPAFPTRRSSDLSRSWVRSSICSLVDLLEAVDALADADAHLAGHDLLCRHPDPRGPGGRRMRSRDRKSTRLNSSHVSTSYAVFCLKKKKRTHI